ncbi:MAG TPA: hypothetical protein VJ831_09790 [Jatrophihabitantaceae bacterium]|nr:hypothetical protein [Jatrophihabitantaceae bacterium]
MFVVVQFPIADGRAFTNDSGKVLRPDWLAPEISPMLARRDFVRGFGRQAYRRQETSAAWIDEDLFVYAKRAVQLPTLARRHFADPTGSRWMVSCRFRRLFCDAVATARVEVGFAVSIDPDSTVRAEDVLRSLLELPAFVPGEMQPAQPKQLITVGPYLARRFARATTKHHVEPALRLVEAGAPLAVVESLSWESATPAQAVAAPDAVPHGGKVWAAATGTAFGHVETWYLGDLARSVARDARLTVLRRHAQEEVLDRVLRWATTGAIAYTPQSAEGDRFEEYVNNATKIVNRDTDRGIDQAPLREALEAATASKRPGVEARRRERLEGMRRQVRLKAERFLADREARKPIFNVTGTVHVGDTNFSGTFYGPVAGTVYAEKMENSFNNLVSQQPDEAIRTALAELHTQVADLVGRLKDASPDDAAEVADTLTSLTDEAAKAKPNKITLRSLGLGIVEAAKKVAEVAGPIAAAVGTVLKVFGIAAL